MAGGEQRTPDEDRAVRMTVMRALEGAWRGRVGEAIAMLSSDRAVMAHAFGRTTLGTLYLESRRPREALDAFSAAAALAPESGEARCNIGVALQQLGRPGEALAAYDEAIRLQPVNVTAHFNRGVVLRLANRLDEAAAAFANAVDLSPKMVEAHVNRGLVCLMLGRHGEALASLDRALALAPGNADIVQARAAALQALGQPVVPPPAPARPPPSPPPGAQAAVARGRILIELERYAEALSDRNPLTRGRSYARRSISIVSPTKTSSIHRPSALRLATTTASSSRSTTMPRAGSRTRSPIAGPVILALFEDNTAGLLDAAQAIFSVVIDAYRLLLFL